MLDRVVCDSVCQGVYLGEHSTQGQLNPQDKGLTFQLDAGVLSQTQMARRKMPQAAPWQWRSHTQHLAPALGAVKKAKLSVNLSAPIPNIGFLRFVNSLLHILSVNEYCEAPTEGFRCELLRGSSQCCPFCRTSIQIIS